MRLRQAKKIIRNVELYPLMRWVYGSGRIRKAYCICLENYKLVNNGVNPFENVHSINDFRCAFQGTSSFSEIPNFSTYNNAMDIRSNGTLYKHTGTSSFPIELFDKNSIDNGEGVE